MTEQAFYYGVGRRKTAVAQVRLVPGNGAITVNGKPVEEAFSRLEHRRLILEPFQATQTQGKFNAVIKVGGGGLTGQAGAIRHSLARALLSTDEKLRTVLRQAHLLTRDPRVKERKKYGLKRARKAPQYTKR